MLDLICRRLTDLASVRIQHAYIRDATKDSYLPPEELVDNAFEAVRLAGNSSSLNPTERSALEDFAAAIANCNPDLSKPDFFDNDPEWCRLRSAAATCLQKLGFDLGRYENQELRDFRR